MRNTEYDTLVPIQKQALLDGHSLIVWYTNRNRNDMPKNATESTEHEPGSSADAIRKTSSEKEITTLASNENPFGPSPRAVAAAQAALNTANFYPERSDSKLCNALATFHRRNLTAKHFFAANSGVEVLSLIEETSIKADQGAIICPPCFGAYSPSLEKKSAKIQQVWLSEDFAVNTEALLAAVGPGTRLVYLCNPNNPTGSWFGEDVLKSILDGLPDHVTLIYDEVYFQFATENGLPDAIKYVLEDRNIVIVHSFSKAYGLAGMRIGYGIAPPRIALKIQQAKRPFHINSVSMAAAIAALDDADHLRTTVDNNHAERIRLTQELPVRGLEVTPSQANFIMFKCPEGKDAAHLTQDLAALGVMVRPAFNLKHHIRATIGTHENNTRLLAALDTILEA